MGRTPTFPPPETLSADALRKRIKRSRSRKAAGKASATELAWLEAAELYRSGNVAPPSGQPSTPGTEGEATAPPVESGPAVESAFAESPASSYEPRYAYEPPPSSPSSPPSSPPPGAGQPPRDAYADGSRPHSTHETPPPPGWKPDDQKTAEERAREEQLKQWREQAGVKLTLAVCGLHRQMAAKGWPHIPDPEAVFFMLPWAISDFLHEKFPDGQFSHRDLRNAVLGSAVGTTGVCYGIGWYSERSKQKAEQAKKEAAQRAQARTRAPEPDLQRDDPPAAEPPSQPASGNGREPEPADRDDERGPGYELGGIVTN